MADKLMRAQVTIPLDDAVPENYMQNTFYFDGDDGLTDSIYHAHVEDMLTDFYGQVDGSILSSAVGAAASVAVYDMRDATPRIPEHEFTIPLTPRAASSLPHEVAVCVSFAAAPQSGANPQRRRGRVYLGPIATDCVELVNGQPFIAATFRNNVRDGAAGLLVPRGEALGPKVSWAIYSPTTHAASNIDDAFNDVQSGWVDNAFDTQRRRGPRSTSRSTF